MAQIKYCGMKIEAMNLESVNAEFDSCISQAICKIAVQEAEDLAFGFLGAAEEEAGAVRIGSAGVFGRRVRNRVSD
jgi:hypothetical protein